MSIGYKIDAYAERMIGPMIAVAFAIRDSREKITYDLLFDLCILNDNIRKLMPDLSTVDREDIFFSGVNPTSAVLYQAEKIVKERNIFEQDKELTKDYNKIISKINEDKKVIYESLYNDIYLYELARINNFKSKYGASWNERLKNAKKQSVEHSYETVYEFIKSEKAIKYLQDTINHIINLSKGQKYMDDYVESSQDLINTIIEEYKKYKLFSKAKRPDIIFFKSFAREKFIEDILLDHKPEIIDIVGLCQDVDLNDIKIFHDINLFLTYKSYTIRANKNCFSKYYDLEEMINHRVRVIGIPDLNKKTGEPIIVPFQIKVSEECEVI